MILYFGTIFPNTNYNLKFGQLKFLIYFWFLLSNDLSKQINSLQFITLVLLPFLKSYWLLNKSDYCMNIFTMQVLFDAFKELLDFLFQFTFKIKTIFYSSPEQSMCWIWYRWSDGYGSTFSNQLQWWFCSTNMERSYSLSELWSTELLGVEEHNILSPILTWIFRPQYLSKRLGMDTVMFGYLQTTFAIIQLLGGPLFGR